MGRKQAQYHLDLIDSLLRNKHSSLDRGQAPRMTSQIPKVTIYPILQQIISLIALFLHFPLSIIIDGAPKPLIRPSTRWRENSPFRVPRSTSGRDLIWLGSALDQKYALPKSKLPAI